ncbi:MAG: Crp/Fnr family transcriptional regulator [Bacteroidales bacterium]|nr:Crp/Fnr family transcriptional regulator [Bacteroidales bacterium]
MPKISRPNSCIKCPYKWEYLDLLKNDDIQSIQNNCTIINFKKGETICKQGTDASHALYLAKGVVKLYIEGKKDLILKLIKAGNYIDLQTLFGDKNYKYSVAAVEDTMVCMINSNLIRDLAKNNNDYLFELTKTISNSGNYIFKKISDISSKQLRGRLADTLIYLYKEIYNSLNFELTLTRKELAELSSMSMENAVRILSEFNKDSIISVDGRKIKILEPELLKKLSDIG